MSDLTIRTSTGSYTVQIGKGTLEALTPDLPVVTLADVRFADIVSGPAVWIEATERNKTLGYAESLMTGLREAGARRETVLLAIGGGVVQDLATLVASLYMRGLRWRYAPTTLMAMADSCIGGKSSINVGGFKNLAGNFHPPDAIAIDPRFLPTLPEGDIIAGLGEAAKITWCRGSDSFQRYLCLQRAFRSGDPERAAPLLHHVLDAKRWFIEIDEFDHAQRRQLNFGHTFGHALEAGTGFATAHGVAVILGMRCAIALEGAGGAAAELDAHCAELLSRVPGLDEQLADYDAERFWAAFASDKKHRDGELHLIVPAAAGGTREAAFPDDGATRDRVLHATSAVVCGARA